MALYILKFGGSSVGTIDRIQHVAGIVKRTRDLGHDVVVVLSAMQGETDRLISLAKRLSPHPDPREYDALTVTGEMVSTSLLSIALNEMNVSARSFNAAQIGIKTTAVHRKARIAGIDTDLIRATLSSGIIPIIAGFQGMNDQGEFTTLGRGGSDTTAVALAAALDADECQIYTDVDGVYTTDPRVTDKARKISRITFEEMLEMASLGAKVLQIRAVEFAGKYNVPLRVLSTFDEGQGTLITYEDKRMEQPLVSGIALDRNQAKISLFGVPDEPGTASKIFGAISKANIDVDVIVQNMTTVSNKVDISFTLQRDDYPSAHKLVQKIAKELGADGVEGDELVAKLSVVGVGMRSHPGVASTMFRAMSDEGINMHLISTSEIKISAIIAEAQVEQGVISLHQAFGLAEEKIGMVKA
tara:strand:+ start:1537 stop:2778 length:1242 start_codon:yes stop_codon:yes gene_type:complete